MPGLIRCSNEFVTYVLNSIDIKNKCNTNKIYEYNLIDLFILVYHRSDQEFPHQSIFAVLHTLN